MTIPDNNVPESVCHAPQGPGVQLIGLYPLIEIHDIFKREECNGFMCAGCLPFMNNVIDNDLCFYGNFTV